MLPPKMYFIYLPSLSYNNTGRLNIKLLQVCGAACRNRTDHLPLTRRLLYQMSYAGFRGCFFKHPRGCEWDYNPHTPEKAGDLRIRSSQPIFFAGNHKHNLFPYIIYKEKQKNTCDIEKDYSSSNNNKS